MNVPDRKKIVRILSLALYFLAAFAVFLVVQFPYGRIKTRIESEVRSRTPYELHIARIAPRFLNRFVMEDVVVSDRTGTVLFEAPAVHTRISLLPFLRGLLSVRLTGRVYGGELAVRSEQGSSRRLLAVDADGLDIGSYRLLRDRGFKVSGRLGGSFEMINDAGKGRLWLKGLASRELKVMGFPVPDLDFEQGWIEVEVKGDRLLLKRLELDGRELKVRITGDLVMQERGSLNLVVKLRPSERLSREQAGLLSLLKNRDAEGFYQFSLAGTVAEPLPRF
jgi:type II secretion system protein N